MPSENFNPAAFDSEVTAVKSANDLIVADVAANVDAQSADDATGVPYVNATAALSTYLSSLSSSVYVDEAILADLVATLVSTSAAKKQSTDDLAASVVKLATDRQTFVSAAGVLLADVQTLV